jgi:hypothetical protein
VSESRYITYEIIDRRQVRYGERYIDKNGNVVSWDDYHRQSGGIHDIVRPVDPARVTVAPEPEAYKVVGAAVRFPNGTSVHGLNPLSAEWFAAELNRLHCELAAKGGA